jgi:methylenetetrahydrofolate--tRNA-(uracil-5-)-methyltransferase
VILATGPLTDGALASELERFGGLLNYHDAIAPLVSSDSLDMSEIFFASRYEDPNEDGAYLNCPMNEEQYRAFVEALVSAEKTPLHQFETAPFFEGCLPVEELAGRGVKTLAFGPLKPVGLTDPKTGRRPYAVVQLRRENLLGDAFNLVGFQTRLLQSEQRRVFRMIPGLGNAVFERFGQVHRNTFVNAPSVLDEKLRLMGNPSIFIAGQLSGVEGYVESIAGGFLAGLFAASEILETTIPPPPPTTAMGGLLRYLSIPQKNFQPSNVVWSMIDTDSRQKKEGKRAHREAAATKALSDFAEWQNTCGIAPTM